MDALEVVNAIDRLDAIPLVARLEGEAVDELHEARHRFVAGEVGDVHALDHSRWFGEAEHLLQTGEPLLRIDEKHLWLHVLLKVAPLIERLQQTDLVSEPRRPLELERLRGLQHFLVHLGEQLLFAAVEKGLQPVDVLAILLLRNPQVAGSGALVDRGQQARAEPTPLLVVGVDVECAGAKLEDPLQHHDRPAERSGARERPVEFHPLLSRRPRELDSWKILVGRDLQVGKGLVVLEVGVEPRLDVLDESALEQEGIDLAVCLEVVDVANLTNEIGRATILCRRLEKVAAGSCPQVLRLADVDHAARGVLHQVDARGLRERPYLLRGDGPVPGRCGGVGVGRRGLRGHLGVVIVARAHGRIVGGDTAEAPWPWAATLQRPAVLAAGLLRRGTRRGCDGDGGTRCPLLPRAAA